MVTHSNVTGGAAMKNLIGVFLLALLILFSAMHDGLITVNYELLNADAWETIDWLKPVLATVLITSYFSRSTKKQP
ncbi:MAG: hypothetical protein K0R84_674 [Clostridia bacterium]|jgi:uncharacterized membrane protein (Fun14 family)|nr:hypothetical protein [Clostridia bacterium]